jgi:hypothetical protein
MSPLQIGVVSLSYDGNPCRTFTEASEIGTLMAVVLAICLVVIGSR